MSALSWTENWWLKNTKGKQYLIVHDSMLDKVLDNIIEIVGIEKFDDTKILLNTDDKLPDDITLKNAVIL